MSRQVFVIRPEPGLSATLTAGRGLGLNIYGKPLFKIEPVDWTAPDSATVDALLIGSANAIRHGGPQLDSFRGKPVYAVGTTTAERATEAGFQVDLIGKGGLQTLLDGHKDTGAAPMRYLRLSGAEKVALSPPPGISIDERTVYKAMPLSISADFEKRLRAGGIVLLHSAAAACHFAGECARLQLERHTLFLATLGPRISASANEGWAGVRHPDSPDDAALLALVKDMCQDH